LQQIVWEKDLSELIVPNYRFVLEDDNAKPDSHENKAPIEVKREEKRIVKLKS